MTATREPDTSTEEPLNAAIGSFIERPRHGSLELAAIELGMRLGLHTALARKPSTPAELANTADIDQRYACEWLEQQATAGIVLIESEPHDGEPDGRVFRLPTAHRECLLVRDMAHPVGVLASVRRMALPGGAVFVVDERAADALTG